MTQLFVADEDQEILLVDGDRTCKLRVGRTVGKDAFWVCGETTGQILQTGEGVRTYYKDDTKPSGPLERRVEALTCGEAAELGAQAKQCVDLLREMARKLDSL